MMLPTWSAAAVAIAVFSTATDARHNNFRAPFQRPVPSAQERLQGPASTYANLSPAECRKRLSESPWAASFRSVGPHNGVAHPLRIVAPLHGVNFQVPPDSVSYGVLDCRQALLWSELAPLMARHGIESIRIDNFYRNRARVGRGRKSQHAYALAADVVSVTFAPPRNEAESGDEKGPGFRPPSAEPEAQLPGQSATTTAKDEASDGQDAALPLNAHPADPSDDESARPQNDAEAVTRLGYGEADVERDFLGEIGKPVCGPKARIEARPDSDWQQIARAVRLRNLVCEWGRMGAFHHILTPNYDRAHQNHLHLDLQRDNEWFSLR